MALNCLKAIAGTAGIKAATWTDKWADEKFVKFDQRDEQELHRSTSLSQCFSNDVLKIAKGAAAASPRANTTISILVKFCLCSLKLSRATLLMRLRATARRTFFLAIAKPKRGCCRSLLIAKRVKYVSEDLTGLANTRLYSPGLLIRVCGEKLKSAANAT